MRSYYAGAVRETCRGGADTSITEPRLLYLDTTSFLLPPPFVSGSYHKLRQLSAAFVSSIRDYISRVAGMIGNMLVIGRSFYPLRQESSA